MTDREFAEFQYKLGYYEEFIQKRLKANQDLVKLDRLERKLDEWYFQSVDVVEERENQVCAV